jgi:chromosome segregation ATPase
MFAMIGVLLLALAGGAFGFFQYSRTQRAHRQQVAELDGRIDQLQRRQAEERVRADQAQRLNESLKTQLAKLQEEYDGLVQDSQTSVGKAQRQIRELKQQIARLNDKAVADQARNEKLQAENGQLKTALKQANEKADKLAAAGQDLEKKLQYTTGQRDRCMAHNAELSEAASDLLDAYENKGVFSALFAKEPITGLKKIEVEHLVQDYRQKVIKNTLP